jgi:hypothetical protein
LHGVVRKLLCFRGRPLLATTGETVIPRPSYLLPDLHVDSAGSLRHPPANLISTKKTRGRTRMGGCGQIDTASGARS